MMDLPPSLLMTDVPAIEWLHVMPPPDSADLVVGYESAFPFLHLASADSTAPAPAP